MSLPVVEKTVKLHRAQLAFRCHSALYRGFVGGRGAGKSWIGAYDLIRRARSARTYLVASPTGVLLQDTTYPTFKAIAQDMGRWESVRLSPYPNVTLTTGATIRFRTAEDPEKMRGPNLSGCWLDEASLMHRDAYLIAIAALREQGEQGWLSATFTPKGIGHWTYENFGTGKPNTSICHAPTWANPFNPPEFYETLAGQYGGGEFAAQELGGEWVAGDEAWQVIPLAWAKAAQARWTDSPPPDQPLSCLGVDVAYGGADQTVIAPRYGPWFGRLKKYRGAVTDSGQKAAFLVLKEYKDNAPVNVDAIGYGSACYEALQDKIGRQAVAVNVANATELFDRSKKYKLTNVRAAMYWKLREALDPETGDGLALPPDPELLGDLTAAKFEVRASGIVIESKENIKERLGRSPDCGDAVALAHWIGKRKIIFGA